MASITTSDKLKPQSGSLPEYITRNAIPSDADFLGTAILESERDLHGTGIWDIFISSKQTEKTTNDNQTNNRDDIGKTVLSHVVLNSDENCIYNLSKIKIVATNDEYNIPVACATGFLYPKSQITDTFTALSKAMKELYEWNENDCEIACKKLDFIDDSYPKDIEYDGKWMIEGVYTCPEHRRKGLAGIVVKAAIENGREIKDSELGGEGGYTKPVFVLISCSVGNDGALKCYEKLGFKMVGSKPFCKECMDLLGTEGFFYLEMRL